MEDMTEKGLGDLSRAVREIGTNIAFAKNSSEDLKKLSARLEAAKKALDIYIQAVEVREAS